MVQEVRIIHMVGRGFKMIVANHYVCVRKFPNDNFIVLLLYINDVLIVGQDANIVGRLKKKLFKHLDRKDLGQHNKFWTL